MFLKSFWSIDSFRKWPVITGKEKLLFRIVGFGLVFEWSIDLNEVFIWSTQLEYHNRSIYITQVESLEKKGILRIGLHEVYIWMKVYVYGGLCIWNQFRPYTVWVETGKERLVTSANDILKRSPQGQEYVYTWVETSNIMSSISTSSYIDMDGCLFVDWR